MPQTLFQLPAHIFILLLLFTRTGAATEPPPRNRGPYKLIAADFTADGHEDLVVCFHDLGILSVERGNGKGQFKHLAVTPLRARDGEFAGGSFNLAAADLDRDGRPDLAVGCRGHFVLLAKNIGDGKFKSKARFATESEAKGVALADLDRDGTFDLLYTARGTGRRGDTNTGRLYLRRGLGDWRFGEAVEHEAGISAYYVEIADLNKDGFVDVVVPNELGSTVSYWLSPGKSIFKKGKLKRRVLKTSGFRINDVRARDFNGDGHIDILTANWATSNLSIFPGRGDGTFGKEHRFPGGKHCVFFAVGDFDQDGDLDFAVTHWTEDFLSVFLNDGRGRFPQRTDYKTGLGNYGVLAVDVTGDGQLDLVTANYRQRSYSLLVGRDNGTFAQAITTQSSFRQTQAGFTREK